MTNLNVLNKNNKKINKRNKSSKCGVSKYSLSQAKPVKPIKPKAYLTVIGGSFRGLKLLSPAIYSTRPTKAILKESLFNTLREEVLNSCFIEAFCGSGSVGIEALSRGAKKIIFLEKEERAIDTLKQNIKRLRLINQVNNQASIEIISGDCFVYLPNILKSLNMPTLLYLDPPFLTRANYADIYQHCLTLIAQIQNPFVKKVIIEHSSTYNMPLEVGIFSCVRIRKFGNSALTYLIQGA